MKTSAYVVALGFLGWGFLGLAGGAAADGGTNLTFYAKRKAFEAAQPGLPVQSFAGAGLSGQPWVVIANDLSASTSDGVFSPGDILPGLTIRTRKPGDASSALIVYDGGPVKTISVGNNWYGDTLELDFSPGVAAVAETVFGSTSAGPSFAGKIHEAVYSGAKLLGGRTYTEKTGDDAFIGVASSNAPITRVDITWNSDGDATTYLSRLTFGTPAP